MKKRYVLPLIAASSFTLTGCWLDSDDDDDAPAPQNILEIAVANANTTILESAVLAADSSIAELLGGEDELTVFAPTDAAFTALLEDLGLTEEELLADEEELNTVLSYHVVSGEVKAEEAIDIAKIPGDTRRVETFLEEDVVLSLSQEDGEDALYVNTSRVTTPDVDATNGVIHIIDKVLVPPPSNLSDTDATIASLVTGLASETPVEGADFTFNTLLAALSTDGATELLGLASDADETLTVFAPTDQAFAAYLDETGLTEAQLLASDDLPGILRDHILTVEAGSLDAYAASGGTPLNTENSTGLNVSIQNNMLMIGGSAVIEADVQASNGVIHVIDQVIDTGDQAGDTITLDPVDRGPV